MAHPPAPNAESVAVTYDRATLLAVLIEHQRYEKTTGCHCGWFKWGASYACHVADVYEALVFDGDHAAPGSANPLVGGGDKAESKGPSSLGEGTRQ